MKRNWGSFRSVWLLFALFQGMVFPGAGSARSDTVTLDHGGLGLTAEFVAGEPQSELPTVLILHGTLAHHRMEIVQTLQAALKERGVGSLAPTLSLGVDRRQGMFDCGLEHRHRSVDAVGEISAWVAWLKARGVSRISLIGHSRGSDQIVMTVERDGGLGIESVVLLAPPTDRAGRIAERYRQSTGQDLASILAEARLSAARGQEDQLMDVPGFLHCNRSRVTAGSLLDYYDPEQRMTAMTLLPRFATRALVIGGTADEVSPDVEGRVAALGLGSHIQLKSIDGADHFFRDLYMDEVADLVRAFLAAPRH